MIQYYLPPLERSVYIMNNVTSFPWFSEGQKDARVTCRRLSYSSRLSVFYRLGFVYEVSHNNPKRLQLIDELLREFSFCKSDLPNYAEFVLYEHYSHRMLRSTMDLLGYRLPSGNLDRHSFHAWRVR